MNVIQHTLETTASPERVWSLWSQVEAWPTWQDGLTGAVLKGPLQAGTRGRVRFPGGGRTFRILAVEPGLRLRWEVRGFLRRAQVEYALEPTPMGCRITHRIEMSGLGLWLDPWLWSGRLARALPEGVRQVARLAASPGTVEEVFDGPEEVISAPEP